MGKTLAAVAVALIASNFIFQAFASENWTAAIERSWFQAMAIFSAWVVLRFRVQ